MGNLCSRSSNNDPEAFTGPGRVVGTSGQQNPAPRAAPPSNTNWKASPGRTLGDTSSPGGAQGAGDEARSNAAIAAQKRADSVTTASKGKLGSKLAAQKAKTQTQTLGEVSRDERAARDVDQVEQARQWS
ncbi:hypothetical protein N7454_003442 [Penicillium verhagenii]|uniref:uncharacterized protein n=1 Tax=Penicillium verhagenii TaxID=1562060 RepID=UPI0025459E0F|nr:uncharacterized protein N7466_002686 [Penicillium verhagenii]KAJ5939552.1 hypothetical protein N7466_002686 [Penicillium verhagenii]KAJ5946603.1 hypothetical protein N7454_003442 [Penicillium verhagenii]